jgi:hypothetical protein
MLRVWIWPAVRSSPRLGRVIGFICIHESLGYLKPLGNRQHIRASRRSATGVIMATVAVLLIAGGCGPEPTPPRRRSSRLAMSPTVAPSPTRLPPSWSRAPTGRSWPWAMLCTPGARRRTSKNATSRRGAVQGANQACPRQPRVLHPRGQRLLRVLR